MDSRGTLGRTSTCLFLTVVLALAGCAKQAPEAPPAAEPEVRPAELVLTADEAREIARDAYIYGNPLVDSYRILYTFFVNQDSAEFKAPWNQLYSMARVFTHEDTTVQAANSDTPYSFAGIDLRTEPVVMTVPEMEAERYFSIQLIDLYTHIVDYIGTRTTGNGGGNYLLAGPGWEGDVPPGIDRVIPIETELLLAIYRTQLFNPDDLARVAEIQRGYGLLPLSAFLGTEAPEQAPPIDFIEPLSAEEIRQSLDVFEQLDFILQFCPVHASEVQLRARFARIGIGTEAGFDAAELSPEIRSALAEGIVEAWQDFEVLKEQGDRGEITSGDVFGTRETLENNYLYRFGGAVLGIWGNAEEEAIYPTYYIDAGGEPLSGENAYTLRFPPGQLPPVNAFWSLTMYSLPGSFLVENPIDRYLLNSTMEDEFVRDADGGITFYFQHTSPGADKEANWLPAPEGPFSVNMRLYWPQEAALDGTWQQPPMIKTEDAL